MQKTALVTGGAGFIGAHVAQELLDMGMKVVVLDDLSGGKRSNVPDGALFVEDSITNEACINSLFEAHAFDYVYHLAAYAAEGLSHFIRRFNYHNNLIGSILLINASVNHNVKCFVFTSSIAVYGAGELPLSENQIPQPEDPYGIAKYAVEMDLKNAHEMFGLNSVIFRPHNVYGSKQNIADKYRNVVGIFMNQVLKGENLTVFGDGEQTRAFSHISDVAPYIAKAVVIPDAYNKTFNIGGDQPYTVNELAEAVLAEFATSAQLTHLEARNEVVHAYADHSLFKSVFNPKIPLGLAEGLSEMAAWVRQTGSQEPTVFEGIEIAKNMPASWLKLTKDDK